MDDSVIARVPDVSVELYLAQAEQLEQAVGSLWLVWAQTGRDLPVSSQDAAATEDLLRRYRPARTAAQEQAAAAYVRGDKTFTLELDLPPQASDDLERLLDLLDEIDALCDQELLGWPAPPRMRTFRRWMLGELTAQVRAPEES